MTNKFPATDCPNLYRRSSCTECPRSSPSNPPGSKNAVLASSKETPCLSSLLFAFLESHSNISIMYILNSTDPQASPQFLPAIRNLVEVHINLVWAMEGKWEKRRSRSVLCEPERGTGTGGDCPAPGTVPFSVGASPFLHKAKGPVPLRGLALLVRFFSVR